MSGPDKKPNAPPYERSEICASEMIHLVDRRRTYPIVELDINDSLILSRSVLTSLDKPGGASICIRKSEPSAVEPYQHRSTAVFPFRGCMLQNFRWYNHVQKQTIFVLSWIRRRDKGGRIRFREIL